jgi:N-acetylmuramoyl-L-alanine amidase CwlA
MIIAERPCAKGNFRKGRNLPVGMKVDQITIHVTEGSAASVRNWFNNPAAEVSAHYMVTKAGEIDQFVDEDDTAFHNGRIHAPTAPLVLERPNVNPNAYSIGIEHEGDGKSDLTPAQRAASAALIADISVRRKIPIDQRHVVGHGQVYAKKSCPGKIDVHALLVAALAETVAPGTTVPVPSVRPTKPLVRWSPYHMDWLIIPRVVSNDEWYFIRGSVVGKMALTRAASPLSVLKEDA